MKPQLLSNSNLRAFITFVCGLLRFTGGKYVKKKKKKKKLRDASTTNAAVNEKKRDIEILKCYISGERESNGKGREIDLVRDEMSKTDSDFSDF